MKSKLYPLLICIFTVFISCKKPSSDPPPPTQPQQEKITLQVKEKRTNIPLSGVACSLYKCSKYDIQFGCTMTTHFATYVTDDKGECALTRDEFHRATHQSIEVSKSQYWNDILGPQQSGIEMVPEAMLNITFKTSKIIPKNSVIEVKNTSASSIIYDRYSYFNNGNSKFFSANKDSTYRYRLYGNERNTLEWNLSVKKDPDCILWSCARDILATGSLTLNPQKFDTLNTTINY